MQHDLTRAPQSKRLMLISKSFYLVGPPGLAPGTNGL